MNIYFINIYIKYICRYYFYGETVGLGIGKLNREGGNVRELTEKGKEHNTGKTNMRGT